MVSQNKGLTLFQSLGGMLAEQIDPSSESIIDKIRPLKFYGDNKKLFDYKTGEVILSGPADTGKTIAALQWLHILCLMFQNLQAAMIRQTAKSIPGSCFESFKNKIAIPGTVIYRGGDLRPEQILYPSTGSVIWVGGLDNPDKVLSSERDVVYINQAEEISLKAYEFITTRANGRAGNMPGSLIMGDCNPSVPTHWIKKREQQGHLTLLYSTHRDNPEIYNQETGELIEPSGRLRLETLSRLTGSTNARLFRGIWVAPEGAIYEAFTEEAHVVNDFHIPDYWPKLVGIDPIGAFTAAVWLAFNPESGSLYVYREYYEPFGLTIPEHAKKIMELSRGETIFIWAGGGPSENQARLDFYGNGIPLVKCEVTDVWAGIDRVNQLIKANALFVFKSCENLLGEIGDYRRAVNKQTGIMTRDIENKDQYHLLDALRYIIGKLTETTGELSTIIQFTNRIGGNF